MLLANIFGFGNPVEIAIIAGVVVLLFGGSKISSFGKSLGEGMKEFKKAAKEINEEETPSSAQPMQQSVASPDGTPHTAEATKSPVTTTKE